MKRYIRSSAEFDADMWRKVSQLHNKLFDYLGLEGEYGKYAREDAYFGIMDDINEGKSVRDAFESTFDIVYETELPEEVFDEYYREVFGE